MSTKPTPFRRWLPAVVVVCLTLSLTDRVAFTQSPTDVQALLKELQAIRESQVTMQRELAELKTLILARPAAAPVAAARPTPVGRTVSVADAPYMGRADAPLTVVEFSDFQCPFCARHFTQSLPAIAAEYIDTGKVRYVFRHFPLDNIHPLAFKASEASECAKDQGRFWQMHDRLFGHPKLLAPEHLPAHAEALALNVADFRQCLASGTHATTVRRDVTEGRSLGITGTPAFLVGRGAPGSPTIRIDAFISGAKAFESFKQEFDRLLR